MPIDPHSKFEIQFQKEKKLLMDKLKEFIEWLKENPDHKIHTEMWSQHEVEFNAIGTPLEVCSADGDDGMVLIDFLEILQAIGLHKGDI